MRAKVWIEASFELADLETYQEDSEDIKTPKEAAAWEVGQIELVHGLGVEVSWSVERIEAPDKWGGHVD